MITNGFRFYVSYSFFPATRNGRFQIRNVTFAKFGIDSLLQEMTMGDFMLVRFIFQIFRANNSVKEDMTRNWRPLTGTLIIFGVTTCCFGFLIYAGRNIIYFLRTSKLISKATNSLQKQLFIALFAQVKLTHALVHEYNCRLSFRSFYFTSPVSWTISRLSSDSEQKNSQMSQLFSMHYFFLSMQSQ